jgi:uncharacterized GH25 family protein
MLFKGLSTISLVTAVVAVNAHTLFVNPESFYFPVAKDVMVPLINGTFLNNENKVSVRRMTASGVIQPDGTRSEIDSTMWSHHGDVTMLETSFARPGNYVLGVGTKPMIARMSPEDFNFYLEYEGLHDDEEERLRLNEGDVAASERYSKFSKAIVQAGDATSDNFGAVLGHRVEIVPLRNPYELTVGDTLRVRLLKDGQPLPGELVYASHEGYYRLSDSGIVEELQKLRSDREGEVEFQISAPGRWYIRFIDLTRTGDQEHWYSNLLVALGVEEQRIPYESLWATLTFEIR